jgi:hypothetical protein
VDHIRLRGPADWTVHILEPPPFLPIIVDYPDDFLPEDVPQADLVLALVESPSSAQLVPDIARRAGAGAVLCPIDNSAWVPTGLKNQLQSEMKEAGVESVFPKPFCTLTEEAAGYGRAAQPYTSRLVSEFAAHFGRPRVELQVDEGTGTITQIQVTRGSACGATEYAARKLEGTSVEKAVPKVGLVSHQYPCLASMDRETIDDRLGDDTLMHVSGYVVNEEFEKKLEPFKEPPRYFTPDGKAPTGGGPPLPH